MKKFIIALAVMFVCAGVSEAGPLRNLVKNLRGCQPVRNTVKTVIRPFENRPVRTFANNVVEAQPVRSTVKAVFSGCPNGTCPR